MLQSKTLWQEGEKKREEGQPKVRGGQEGQNVDWLRLIGLPKEG